MLGAFKKSTISIVAPDGQVRSTPKALLTGDVAIIDDASIVIDVGDEVRRLLPNGHEEVFAVVEPTFYDVGIGGIGPHYQVKLRRKGQFPQHTGGNYSITVSGPNARVNIGSQDNSINTVNESTLFEQIAATIREGVGDTQERDRLLTLIEAMQREKKKPGYLSLYQQLVGTAADHLALLTPFLPALTNLISG